MMAQCTGQVASRERDGGYRPDVPWSSNAEPEPRLAAALDVSAEQSELVADRLFALGATAVSEEPSGPDGVALVADLLAGAVEQLVADGHRVRVLEPDATWTGGWRAHARVWRCGASTVVRPAWLDPVPLAPGDIELVVEPGEAFGSGSHPTTRLCLAALEPLVGVGDRVLDVGCGSGVLGVAAAKRGAGEVVAIDVDPEAVRVTAEVAAANGVGDVVHASGTPLDEVPGSFDLVVANLLAPIVEDLSVALRACVAPGGRLVLSGLLDGQAPRIAALLPDLVTVSEHALDGWIALVLERR